jgi:hypothetical protein
LYNNGVGATLVSHSIQNTAVGSKALYANTIGSNNTAFGSIALQENTTGSQNTAIGRTAMFHNLTGNFNTAVGFEALPSNVSGGSNVAVGYASLFLNDSGVSNVAVGRTALRNNIGGNQNVALGRSAIFFNTTGSQNTSVGTSAMQSNETGNYNSALGFFALLNNIRGDKNTGVGWGADVLYDSLINATAIGFNAKVSTSNSLVLGGTGADVVNVAIGATTTNAYGHGGVNRILEVHNDATVVNAQSQVILSTDGSAGSMGGITWAGAKITAPQKIAGFIGNVYEAASTNASPSASLTFYTTNAGTLSEKVRINNAGNVGIGTTTPNAPLQFANIGANRKIVLWETTNNDHQYYGFGINGATLRYQVDDVTASHKFYAGTSPTTSNELMRIQGSGDVGIGTSATASAYGHGGTNKILELKNTAPAGGNVQSHLILSTSATSGSMGGITWAGTGLSGEQRTGFIGTIYETANQTRLSFYNRDNAGALNERFYIQGTGNAWLAGTLTQASDARLKKNIQPLSSTLKNLNQINGYTYNWIKEQKDNEHQIGLLAQEVQKIYPQLVKENNKGELSVNYTGLIPVLLEGMKEQQKQIDELKKVVQQLIKNK